MKLWKIELGNKIHEVVADSLDSAFKKVIKVEGITKRVSFTAQVIKEVK